MVFCEICVHKICALRIDWLLASTSKSLAQINEYDERFGPVSAERIGPNCTFDPLCLTCPGRQWLGPFSVYGSDEQIFGVTDRHDDISHNGSSEFGGNPDSADTADLVAPCKAWWGPGFDEQIFGADKQVSGRERSD
jgi:hypothetical protein